MPPPPTPSPSSYSRRGSPDLPAADRSKGAKTELLLLLLLCCAAAARRRAAQNCARSRPSFSPSPPFSSSPFTPPTPTPFAASHIAASVRGGRRDLPKKAMASLPVTRPSRSASASEKRRASASVGGSTAPPPFREEEEEEEEEEEVDAGVEADCGGRGGGGGGGGRRKTGGGGGGLAGLGLTVVVVSGGGGGGELPAPAKPSSAGRRSCFRFLGFFFEETRVDVEETTVEEKKVTASLSLRVLFILTRNASSASRGAR